MFGMAYGLWLLDEMGMGARRLGARPMTLNISPMKNARAVDPRVMALRGIEKSGDGTGICSNSTHHVISDT